MSRGVAMCVVARKYSLKSAHVLAWIGTRDIPKDL